MVRDALGGAGRDLPQGRRPARRPVARHAQRRDDARPVEDRLPGRDRRRLRADRLLALQRRTTCSRSTSEQPESAPGHAGTTSSTGRSRASSSRSRRSTSPRIAGNLPTAPALMGNTVRLEAGLVGRLLGALHHEAPRGGRACPPGVINFVPGSRRRRSATRCWPARDLAGIHFTGSTAVFQGMWTTDRRATSTSYKYYPRIVGETGGKDFVFAHASADVDAAGHRARARRLRVPGPEVLGRLARLHPGIALAATCEKRLLAQIGEIRMGDPRDFTQLHGRGDRRSAPSTTITRLHRRTPSARRTPRSSPAAAATTRKGYFIEPTVVRGQEPGLQADARGDLRPGADDLRLRGRRSSTRRSSSATRARPTR